MKGATVKYEIVAEAYHDLEQTSARLALIDRLTALLAATPVELLPTVCYLCEGLIAPQFAGVDLGLAEKLAIRAVATATGASVEQARRAAAGHRDAHHPRCARADLRRRPGGPAGPGTRLQHLL